MQIDRKRNRREDSYHKEVIVFAAEAAFIVLVLLVMMTGCSDNEITEKDICLDTECEVILPDEAGRDEKSIENDLFDDIRSYEKSFSPSIPGSDVYRIAHSGANIVPVSEDTADIVSLADKIGKYSEGAFDITVGGVTQLWDFTSGEGTVPEKQQIEERLRHVGYTGLRCEGNRMIRKDSETSIDMGGIAKGYIADRLCDELDSMSVENALIDLGGDIVAAGKKAGREMWRIGIKNPDETGPSIVATIEAEDESIVTSGIYERTFEQDGREYHHIIDPETGYPAETDLASVTIKAAKGNTAFCDGMATACIVMGKDRGRRFVSKMQSTFPEKSIEAFFIDRNGRISQTTGMKACVDKKYRKQ